jgi:hypothetical protein
MAPIYAFLFLGEFFMVTLLVALLFCTVLEARMYSVPSSIKEKAVYHVQAHQIDDWSCGYNVLFNGCNLEHFLGRSNTYSDFRKFKQVCVDFIRQRGKQPDDGISNIDIEDLATSLGLQKVQYIVTQPPRRIVPLFDSPTCITVPENIAHREAQKLLQQAVRKREDSIWEDLHKRLKEHKDTCIHFVCHVVAKREDHCILVSLVQKGGKDRALYIFDNLNGSIKEESHIKRYIDFLCTTFHVSSMKAYSKHNVKLPARWPTTPQLPPGYYYKYE